VSASLAAPAPSPTVADVYAAIRPHIRRTPVIEVQVERFTGRPATVSLKLELLQHSGSFKVRGAFANLMLRPVPADGVVAASGGNHGAAVAYAAQRLGVPAAIFVPRISSSAKVERIRSYGADLVVTGDSYADALAASQAWAAEREVMSVHAFDQAETILGQATVGAELGEQVADAETVIAPVGGGGLLAGLATWYGRRVRLVGVEPLNAATLTHALAAGMPVDVDVDSSGVAADALAPRRIGEMTFEVIHPVIARSIVVSDEDIRAAQAWLWATARVVAEPAGATALAAVLSGAYAPRDDERVVVVVSGGNTTAVSFDSIPGASPHAPVGR